VWPNASTWIRVESRPMLLTDLRLQTAVNHWKNESDRVAGDTNYNIGNTFTDVPTSGTFIFMSSFTIYTLGHICHY